MTVQAQITMQANLNNPPYTLIMWNCYGEPDQTGAQSGYFGLLDMNSIKVNSIIYNNSTQNPLTLTVGGDLSGSLPNPSVSGLQGSPISSTAPTVSGQLLGWNGTSWNPENVGAGLKTVSNTLSVGQNADNNILVNSNNIQLSNSQSFVSSFSLTTGALFLTGTGGIELSGPITLENGSFLFDTTAASPTISQLTTSTNSAVGNTLTVQAQNASGTTSHGGTLLLTSGTGTAANGSLFLATGGTARLLITDTVIDFTVPTVQFLASVSSPNIGQATQTSNIPANTLNISAQAPYASASGANRSAGIISLNLAAPVSGGNRGAVYIQDAVAGTAISLSATAAGTAGEISFGGSGVSLINGYALSINPTSLGFFSATPISQPARAGQITDNTTGSATTTFAAITAGSSYSQSDMVACKNALASIAAQYNKIDALLHNIGIEG